MADNNKTERFPDERIVDIDLTKELSDSFLEYSYSVIYARALPDARDGLKPVQRRIIYQMGEMGLRPDRGHVKSARVSGEVMGKLHPHGDGAIYDAMVRMAQPFTLRVPLIDGHGNFGSLDDGPAAARYTETRLAPAALLMNESLDEDVVDFKPNYDAQLSEPEVLPAAFPNLLVNGSSGIAVGMATNMAPHNLREVIAGAIALLNNTKLESEDLMKYIPGPDLPTGGVIIGTEGITEAYMTGRGSFKTRARVSIESVSPRKLALVVTELPYLVGPERVIEKIKDGVNSKKLQGISDVIDLTDRNNGLKLVIELKTGFDPNTVLDLLYRFTPLEESFSINNVALVEGKPETLDLRDLLGVYLAHRIVVTKRRTENRLGKKQARLHLVEGLLKAIVNIDEVIRIIRNANEVDDARKKLMQKYILSELQAEYILELKLRRLTKFSKLELETESKELAKEIADLKKILGSEKVLRDLVTKELQEVSDKYGDDRRTTILDAAEEVKPVSAAKAAAIDAQLADSPCFIVLTASGQVQRTLLQPEPAIKRKKHDAVRSVISTSTRSDIGFLTSDGVMHRVHASDIPASEAGFDSASSINVAEFLGVSKQSRVLNAFPLTEETVIAMGTKQGIVKRLNSDFQPKSTFEVISMKPGDELVGAELSADDHELVFVTSDAQLLRFDASLVRPLGRGAAGMAGIKIADNAKAIYFNSIAPTKNTVVLTAANNSESLGAVDAGSLKLSSIEEFPPKGRATGGVRAHKFIRDENQLYFAYVGELPVLASASSGKALEINEKLAKRDSSGTPLSSTIIAAGRA
ncbi:MAG: DNA topoisomerase IV subunit A [Micrococcales bacterium]|nr:DNA topoisomerase IV subunit A [Micrococcales bacterium]NBR54608.1 DNA topoisomerase IV subunit A [Micrococcales bacterium]NBR61364.1 DNA topoisomerase IV subunit A [Actinomycetota bacterium]NBT46996.1 DNA topoisomerase IV subunit A [Actinomycetota bacterium]NBY43812.1 DNA topoisomerase IV subunit A [Micrococcales bacterium]